MKKIIFSKKFSKEYSLMFKRGKDLDKLKNIIDILANNSPLPLKYRDHKLMGCYEGSRELHIEPDWLLIYRLSQDSLILERTGSHSDLFK